MFDRQLLSSTNEGLFLRLTDSLMLEFFPVIIIIIIIMIILFAVLQDYAAVHTIQRWSELNWASHWVALACWVFYLLIR